MPRALSLFLLFISLLFVTAAKAQAPQKTRILIILDCSGSMKQFWDKTDRMTAAKNITIRMVDSMKSVKNVELALRCYGHQHTVAEHICTDSKLEVPFGAGNAGKIIDFIKKVQPNGWTPIAYSLQQSAADFPDSKTKNVIILVTDGLEECEGDPCAVVVALEKKNIQLRKYIIGIGLDDTKMTFFDCVGKYYNPKNEKEMGKVFSGVISQALDNTTVQVHLLDGKSLPKNTDNEMTFINASNGKVVYNFYHTLNARMLPDTFEVDPTITYNVVLNTTPSIEKKNVVIQTAHHNIIKFDAPEGTLRLGCKAPKDYHDLNCLVRKSGSSEILFVQALNTQHRYLQGLYDLEFLTLPRISIPSTKITDGQINNVLIPQPGTLSMSYPKDITGSIYINRNNTLEWVADLNGHSTSRKEAFTLQPGNYTIVYKPFLSNVTTDSRERFIVITTGGSFTVSLDL